MKRTLLKKGNKKRLLKRCLSLILSGAVALPMLVPEKIEGRKSETVHAADDSVIYGDVNSDSKIDILDMVLLKSYLAENNTKGFSVKAADLDDDGKVSSKDAVELSMYLMSRIGSFSYEMNVDTDGDGLSDYIEKEILGTDYKKRDTDGDGLDDYSEVYLCDTDPLSTDTGKTGVKDSLTDTDGDKLTNAEEITLGTSPTLTDTDEDGLSDYDEVKKYKTDPLKEDTDGDGISDNGEIKLGLDPIKVKSDGNTSDAERTFEQKLSSGSFHLSEENPYSLDVLVKSTGYIEDIVKVSLSRYSEFLDEDEILGDIIDIEFSDLYKLENLELSFSLKNIPTPKNYMIFKYNDDATMLLPIYTKYSDNTLIVDDIDDGTYCIANINEMTDNIVNDIKYESENYSETTVLYNSSLESYLDIPSAEIKTDSLNLVYEICIDNNCKVPSWDAISSAIIETNNKLIRKGCNVNTTFIFTICGYSVDISCSNISDLKNICSVVTSFFNDSSITTLNAAYNVYQKNRIEKLDVWKDFSNYYLANTNIISKSNFSNNNIVFIINSRSQFKGKYSEFNISGVRCCAYNAFFSIYNKMFENEIKNNINGSPSDVMYALILYVLNIDNKMPIMCTLFGKVLVDNNSSTDADSDSDGRADSSELNYSKKTTLGKITSSSSLLTKGKEQFQSLLSNKESSQVDINDMEIIPVISDPSRIDSDGDGIYDSDDNAPLEKGIYNDGKLVTGELILLSCKGASAIDILLGDRNTGHAFLLYKSYIRDSLDLSNFNSGYDYCNSNIPERNYTPSDYSIEPDKYLTIGAGGFSVEDAQCAVYNMEFYKGNTYIPNSYIKTDINSYEWGKLLEAISVQAKKEYGPIKHNCTHVAIYIWNHTVSADYNPFNNVHLTGVDTPTYLYDYLSGHEGVKFDLAVNELSR